MSKKSQIEEFKKTARALGTDDDPTLFKRRLKRLMEAPPPDENVPGSKKAKKPKKPAN